MFKFMLTQWTTCCDQHQLSASTNIFFALLIGSPEMLDYWEQIESGKTPKKCKYCLDTYFGDRCGCDAEYWETGFGKGNVNWDKYISPTPSHPVDPNYDDSIPF